MNRLSCVACSILASGRPDFKSWLPDERRKTCLVFISLSHLDLALTETALNVLGLFAKHWTPGLSKTRLAASTGCTVASNLARWLLVTALEENVEVGDDRWLLCWPPERRDEFAAIPQSSAWHVNLQCEGDLTDRLNNFFARAFGAGARRVIAIGTDCPALSREHCEAAFAVLKDHDAVIGPAADGGYYLIGLSRMSNAVFERIPWSTSDVFPATIERLQQANLTWEQLELLADLDNAESLPVIERQLLAAPASRIRQRWPAIERLLRESKGMASNQ